MSPKARVMVVLAAATVFSSVLGWMAFRPNSSANLWHNPFVIGGILALCIVPIYSLCRQLGKRTASSGIAILLLIGALACGVMYGVADLVLHLESPWVYRISDLTVGLILGSCVIFVWNGFRRRSK